MNVAEVRRVLRYVLAARLQQREELHASVKFRMLVEQASVRAETPDDVLRRIGAVDAHDELLRPGPLECGARGAHFLTLLQGVQRSGVDADRVMADLRNATVAAHRAGPKVDVGAEQF